MATRADVLSMARMYSQVPTTLLGDTQAYLMLDQEDRNLWNEISLSNPMLLASYVDITYPANTEYYAITSPTILRLVLVGKKNTQANINFSFEYPLKYLEFVELELQNLVNLNMPQYKFHWDGARIHCRPMPSDALLLRLAYVPPITLGTGTTGTVMGNVTYLQQFADLLSVRLAIRMLAAQGRDTGTWPALAAERFKTMEIHIEKAQDAEPHHVGMTDAFRENRGELGTLTDY